jgi:hypothetical protein
LESVTAVDGMDVTKDEIRTYTAGLVIVLDQKITTKLDGDTTVVKVDLLAQIDTEEAAQAIATLRNNEDARAQLAGLKRDNERLQRELEATNRLLADASMPDQAARQRREILYRVQSNAMVTQALTDWALVSSAGDVHPRVGVVQPQALLHAARDLYPASPHVAAAERMMATRRPPALPQPPFPPAPGNALARMPKHEIVPYPGSERPPRTLNEITYRTPAGMLSNDKEPD